MIYSLNGTLTHTEPGVAVISCGGVGFKCLTTSNTLNTLPPQGKDTFLYTHLNVREDALDLFGFATEQELHCFRLLIGVSGVGPKAALSILSQTTPAQFAFSVASGDAKALTRAPGIGNKTAQRIVLELKDKISGEQAASSLLEGTPAPVVSGGNAAEAVSALVVLGYSNAEAMGAVGQCDSALSVEDMIRQALRLLARA
ncbi:MAG: Holliday junction branch migration protein RuvA [Ethanoligenens sp.]